MMNQDIAILNRNIDDNEGTVSSEIKYSSAEILVESKEPSVISHQPIIVGGPTILKASS